MQIVCKFSGMGYGGLVSDVRHSAAKIVVVLDKRRKLANGNFPFKLRITFGKRQFYFRLSLEAPHRLYERLNSQRLSAEASALKATIRSIEEQAEAICSSMTIFRPTEFRRTFYQNTESTHSDLFDHFTAYIEELRNSSRMGTARSYHNAMRSIAAFVNGTMNELVVRQRSGKRITNTTLPKLSINVIDCEWLAKYQAELERIGCSVATIGIYIRSLRAVYNKAMKADPSLALQYPFGKGKHRIRTSTKSKQPVSTKDILRIYEYAPSTKTELLGRDLWLLSYLLNGANFADIIRLRHSQLFRTGDTLRISFVREKTKRGSREVHITATFCGVQRILVESIIAEHGTGTGSQYIFPFINECQSPEEQFRSKQNLIRRVNKALCVIGKKLGIQVPLTTYVARHSFASNLLKLNAPILFISQQLGHTNLTTTQTYLHGFDSEEMQRYQEGLLDASKEASSTP